MKHHFSFDRNKNVLKKKKKKKKLFVPILCTCLLLFSTFVNIIFTLMFCFDRFFFFTSIKGETKSSCKNEKYFEKLFATISSKT